MNDTATTKMEEGKQKIIVGIEKASYEEVKEEKIERRKTKEVWRKGEKEGRRKGEKSDKKRKLNYVFRKSITRGGKM